jgi:hypothetical protein
VRKFWRNLLDPAVDPEVIHVEQLKVRERQFMHKASLAISQTE